MPATEIRLPQSGMGMTDGTIVAWHRHVGERIEQGEPLCDVEAAKATIEMAAPVSGIIAALLVAAGQNVPVNTPIARIDEGGGEVAVEPMPPAPSTELQAPPAMPRPVPDRRPSWDVRQIEPRARRAAKLAGIDLAAVRGTGPRGRVTAEDVLAHRMPAPSAVPSRPPLAWLGKRIDGGPLRALHSAIEEARPGVTSLAALTVRAAARAWTDSDGGDVAVAIEADDGWCGISGAGTIPLAEVAAALTRPVANREGETAPVLWIDLDPLGADAGAFHPLTADGFSVALAGISDTDAPLAITIGFHGGPGAAKRAGRYLAAFVALLAEPIIMLAI